MTVSCKFKPVEKTFEYECDVLFKRISKCEVHKTFENKWVISKEAFNKLPKSVQDSEIVLEGIVLGCGNEKDKFKPEMLHEGIWLLREEWSGFFTFRFTLFNAPLEISYASRDDCFTSLNKFETITEAVNFSDTDKKTDARAWVFQDGIVVKAFKYAKIHIHQNLFPNNYAI